MLIFTITHDTITDNMESQELFLKDVLADLKAILASSLPHCDDGNELEDEFIKINKTAHSAVVKIERLFPVKKVV